jgi:Nucleotide modification associated domain 2
VNGGHRGTDSRTKGSADSKEASSRSESREDPKTSRRSQKSGGDSEGSEVACGSELNPSDQPSVFSYVVTHDKGFAPNPYFGFLTLATCKPQIRKSARVGDWLSLVAQPTTRVADLSPDTP